MIRDARDGDWITVPETVRTDLMTDLLSWEAGLNVRDNLLALLGSDEVLVTKQHRELMDVVRLHHYTMNLPPLRRTILLSATAEPWMSQRLLESREITSHTVPPVEHSGEIVQHLNRTYSREDFRRNGVPEIDDGIPVISFKGERGSFSDMVENFGGCEGLDRYRGEDLAVVGTPHVHESAYRLMNRALGFDGGEHHMAYRTVEERGLRFKFMTYWDEFMRRIQLWYIRSELLQAVGRARTIDHDCTVQLYSNYPLAGTEKRF
jgi:hypothetical protein